jgi:SH3 domain-containing YSC84-like protein 1
MKRKFTLAILLFCLGIFAWAQDNRNDRTSSESQTSASGASELREATEVVEHMSGTAPDKGIPKEVLEGAKCVAVIPKLVKGAFIVGGEHGTGVATCRTATNNKWSAPAPFSVSGMNALLSGHLKVGADVSAVGGPVGRQASAEAGWKAGILTYSGSKGAFIGASLNGAELQQDKRATRNWYSREASFKDILQGNVDIPNADARAFVNAVENAKETAQVH